MVSFKDIMPSEVRLGAVVKITGFPMVVEFHGKYGKIVDIREYTRSEVTIDIEMVDLEGCGVIQTSTYSISGPVGFELVRRSVEEVTLIKDEDCEVVLKVLKNR